MRSKKEIMDNISEDLEELKEVIDIDRKIVNDSMLTICMASILEVLIDIRDEVRIEGARKQSLLDDFDEGVDQNSNMASLNCSKCGWKARPWEIIAADKEGVYRCPECEEVLSC